MLSYYGILHLPHDIKVVIASKDASVWIWFYLYDKKFTVYAKQQCSIDLFINLFTEKKVIDGATAYILFDKYHRLDGPAIIRDNGQIEWRNNNKFHRDDGPAVIRPHGQEEWYNHGIYHRVGGPAINDPNKYSSWWYYGIIHRTDGPAIVSSDGYQAWYLWGERHRENGPAVVYANGYEEWYRHGKRIDDDIY